MSRIDDLIDGLCPSGVEFKRLGDVARIKNGKDHKQLGDGEIPVYGSGGVMRFADTYAYDQPSVLIPRKGSLGNLFYVDIPFWTVDTIFYTEIDQSQVLPKFLYYFLTTVGLGEMNQAGGVPSQTQSVLNELKVPVPPLPIQREIASILDKMESLEAELEAELEYRSRQYAFYRNKLLTFPEAGGVRWVLMGEVASVRVGQAPIGALVDDGEYRFVNAGTSASGRIAQMNTSGDTVTIPSRGQGGVGIVGYQLEDFWCGPLCYRIKSTAGDLGTRFLYHFLKSVQPAIRGLQQTGGTPALNRKELVLVRVPVPPREIQERIVAILDKFDALVNDLSIGLPAEIAARQKQYAYYRDRLLAFEELQESA